MAVAVLAVVGTLLGAVVTGTFQHLAARHASRAGVAEHLRRERLEAVVALAEAGSDHRRALWMRGEAVLRGAGVNEVERLRARSHASRAAITRPLVSLQLTVPDEGVHAAAKAMVVATYDMVDAAGSLEELTAAQETARAAHDRFIATTAAYVHSLNAGRARQGLRCWRGWRRSSPLARVTPHPAEPHSRGAGADGGPRPRVAGRLWLPGRARAVSSDAGGLASFRPGFEPSDAER